MRNISTILWTARLWRSWQIGLEQTPQEYIKRLVEVFTEDKRVLKPDGTLWVNIGDSYAGSRKGGATHPDNAGKYKQGTNRGLIGAAAVTGVTWGGCKHKDLIGVPWMLAFALRDAGWYLRQDIIWAKPNPMPESVKDRCTKSHEYIFLFSKSKKYYFDNDSIREPLSEKRAKQAGQKVSPGNNAELRNDVIMHDLKRGSGGHFSDGHNWYINPLGKNKRDVWFESTKPYKGAHFATFPVELITPCILAGSPENGTVLDPFCGSGTTGVAAAKYNRKYLLIDISADYIEIARKRLSEY